LISFKVDNLITSLLNYITFRATPHETEKRVFALTQIRLSMRDLDRKRKMNIRRRSLVRHRLPAFVEARYLFPSASPFPFSLYFPLFLFRLPPSGEDIDCGTSSAPCSLGYFVVTFTRANSSLLERLLLITVFSCYTADGKINIGRVSYI